MALGENSTGTIAKLKKSDVNFKQESAVMLMLHSKLSFGDATIISQYRSWSTSLKNIM